MNTISKSCRKVVELFRAKPWLVLALIMAVALAQPSKPNRPSIFVQGLNQIVPTAVRGDIVPFESRADKLMRSVAFSLLAFSILQVVGFFLPLSEEDPDYL